MSLYVTPAQTIEDILHVSGALQGAESVLEPSAGTGSIVRVLLGNNMGLGVTAIERERDYFADDLKSVCHYYNMSFFDYPEDRRFDLVITNPPFSKFEPFLEKSLRLSDKVLFLLRITLLSGIKRSAFLKKYPPTNVWLLARRPDFGRKCTDLAGYCWVLWEKDGENETKLHWL